MPKKKVQLAEIDSVLNRLGREDPGWEGGQWTRMIKEELVRLAATYGCEAYASQCTNAKAGEWLYDVVWLQAGEGQNEGMLTDSPLVAEIEWDRPGAVMDDFQKLLLARADTRLMIFATANTTLAEKRTETLIQQIHAYSRTESGDRYIFACLDNRYSDDKPFNFSCREYVHQGQRR
jgi:hypothetical protein